MFSRLLRYNGHYDADLEVGATGFLVQRTLHGKTLWFYCLCSCYFLVNNLRPETFLHIKQNQISVFKDSMISVRCKEFSPEAGVDNRAGLQPVPSGLIWHTPAW